MELKEHALFCERKGLEFALTYDDDDGGHVGQEELDRPDEGTDLYPVRSHLARPVQLQSGDVADVEVREEVQTRERIRAVVVIVRTASVEQIH